MVKKFISFLKERWETVPAAPVVVLPYESNESRSDLERIENMEEAKLERNQSSSNNNV